MQAVSSWHSPKRTSNSVGAESRPSHGPGMNGPGAVLAWLIPFPTQNKRKVAFNLLGSRLEHSLPAVFLYHLKLSFDTVRDAAHENHHNLAWRLFLEFLKVKEKKGLNVFLVKNLSWFDKVENWRNLLDSEHFKLATNNQTVDGVRTGTRLCFVQEIGMSSSKSSF